MDAWLIDLPKRKFFVMGDTHLHYPNDKNDHTLRKYVKYCLENQIHFIDAGDTLDFSTRTSKTNPNETHISNHELKKYLVDIYKPLAQAGLLDGIIEGNHTMRAWDSCGLLPIEDVVDRLNSFAPPSNHVRYLKSRAVIVYKIPVKGEKNQQGFFKIYVGHGAGGGATDGGAVNALKKNLSVVRNADLYIEGHRGKCSVTYNEILDIELPRGSQGTKVYLNPSEIKFIQLPGLHFTKDSYAEQKGYPPSNHTHFVIELCIARKNNDRIRRNSKKILITELNF